MTPRIEIAEKAPTAPPSKSAGGFEVSERLRDCATKLREHLRGPAVSHWLKENRSLVESHIADLRQTLRPSLLHKLQPNDQGEPRIYRIVTGWLASVPGVIDNDVLLPFAETLRETEALNITELWAFAPMLKFAIVERLCANLDSEPLVIGCVRTLWALEAISWKTFVENASRAEAALKRDPAGVYSRMDLATRDRYRLELSRLAAQANLSEEDAANAVLARAQQAAAGENADSRASHVGYYLVGPGAKDFRHSLGSKRTLAESLGDLTERHPNVCYAAGAILMMALLMAGFAWLAGPLSWWLLLFSPFLPARPRSKSPTPVSAACSIRASFPAWILSAPFPTIAKPPSLSPRCCSLKPTAPSSSAISKSATSPIATATCISPCSLISPMRTAPETDDDAVLRSCASGVRQLNERYGRHFMALLIAARSYLLHRARRWNPQERKWMGYERKRGKLNDLNKLLLGHGNWFNTIVGDMASLLQVRYVITLDTDTQLPRDTASKMIAAMAHPLNRPRRRSANQYRDAKATRCCARKSPSAWNPRSAPASRRIFSGLPGFDPYSASVSDVYQDLHGVASFTGKGIYDVRAFDAAVGERFPENSILSHDLIEGEHARTGLIPVELVEDYPATYGAFSKRKHRWVRGDWQLLPWLFPHPPLPPAARKRIRSLHFPAGRSSIICAAACSKSRCCCCSWPAGSPPGIRSAGPSPCCS